MKILFVAPNDSIHTRRWISQIKDENWSIYLFPSRANQKVHEGLKDIHCCASFNSVATLFRMLGMGKLYTFFLTLFKHLLLKMFPHYRSWLLNLYIRILKPDIVHSLETQNAGYFVAKSRKRTKMKWPPWWHTNWGSDIFIFGNLPLHQPQIRKVFENCDYYSCECNRDVELAFKFGFKGVLLPVYPNTGGFDIKEMEALIENTTPTSRRKVIMLKGYQGWAGRALTGIRALERCSDLLTGFKIVLYSNADGEDVAIASALFTNRTGVPVQILKKDTPHREILALHGESRISIGLSIGDAISTSLLEAMVMGAFPIQSCTACASEWIQDGISGLIVPPEDPEIIEMALRKALLDDDLVDNAARKNSLVIASKADYHKLAELTIQSYKQIYSNYYATF